MTKWTCDYCQKNFADNKSAKKHEENCHFGIINEDESQSIEVVWDKIKDKDSSIERSAIASEFYGPSTLDDIGLSDIISTFKLYLNDKNSLIAIALTILIIFSTTFYEVSENSMGLGFEETADGRTYGNANGVTTSGDYAYVADGIDGLIIINIKDPANPTLAGNFNTGGFVHDVTTSGDYAYVADGTSGLTIINIEDPTNPTYVYNYDTPGNSRDVTISGNYAYVADGANGVTIINMEDSTNPTLAGNYDTGGYAYEVTTSGGYAYVAYGANGLVIIEKTSVLEEIVIILSLSACISYLYWRQSTLTIKFKIPEAKDNLKIQITRLKEKGIKTDKFEEIIKTLK